MKPACIKSFIILSATALSLNASAQQSEYDSALDAAPTTSSSSMIVLKVGPSFSSMSGMSSSNGAGTNQASISSRGGLSFGLNFDLALGDSTSLETGLEYIRRGFSMDTTEQSVPVTVGFNMNNLVLPLLIKFKSGDASSTRVSFGIGPYLGYRVGTSVTVSALDQSETISIEDNGDKKLDIGARATLGTEFPLSSSNVFTLGAGYDFGFTDLASGQESSSVSTRSLMIQAGLGFRI